MPLMAEWQQLTPAFFLVLARVAGVLAFVPLPGVRNSPEPVRVVLALLLAAALFPLSKPRALPADMFQASGWLLAEGGLGVLLGLTVHVLTEGIVLAAQVFGLQAGYSYASTIDPNSQADASVLQVVAQLAGSLLFLSLGLDREIVGALARSFDVMPPGSVLMRRDMADTVIRLGSTMWKTGLRLALPIVSLLLLVDIALALLGRLQAQLQLLTLAFPVKMLAALAVLALVVPGWPLVFGKTAAEMVTAWGTFLR